MSSVPATKEVEAGGLFELRNWRPVWVKYLDLYFKTTTTLLLKSNIFDPKSCTFLYPRNYPFGSAYLSLLSFAYRPSTNCPSTDLLIT